MFKSEYFKEYELEIDFNLLKVTLVYNKNCGT